MILRMLFLAAVVFLTVPFSGAQAQESETPPSLVEEKLPSEEIVRRAWAASNKADLAEIENLMRMMFEQYEAQAKALHAGLNDFPPRDRIEQFNVMNDLATCLFVKGEALMHAGKSEDAIATFQKVIDEYKWSQSWDPSRGSYWSVAEKSQDSIDVITGKAEEEQRLKEEKPVHKTIPKLAKPGTDKIVNYTKYGKFHNVGTANYRYQVKDNAALIKAIGEGIYPNVADAYRNPGYKKAREEGRLEGSHWDYTNTEDLEAAYFKWATASEPWGVKMFYLGIVFERAGMYHEAIKAYHSIVVHFPNVVAWTYWQTPWYPAQAAISKIRYILREHPELNLVYKWGKIQVHNSFDNTIENDVTITYPGVIREKTMMERMKEKMGAMSMVQLKNIKRQLGAGKVRLVQYENGHWQMMVGDKPFVIKGITYAPTKIGQSPDKGTISDWMKDDFNNNGIIDGPYEAWVDKNLNNQQDADEPTVGDFQLMKKMGANTLRIYKQPFEPNKDLLRKMHKEYGFMVILGDFLGKYTLGSGADWSEGTDYENPTHRQNMKDSVKKMVQEFKDEPYILFWLLGNENNYGVASNADKKPEAYYKFVNEVAQMIKELDPNHPVAICNGDTLFLDVFAKNAPDVDIYAGNVYRGDYGFGSFWQQVQSATDKPAFITEYGAPSYAPRLTFEEAQEAQASYHRGNWMDIETNLGGRADGEGNALGGVAFEWLDEWWKNYEPSKHDKKSDVIGPFPGGYYYEEWFGLVSQGDGKSSPYLRQPKKVYYTYTVLWNKKF